MNTLTQEQAAQLAQQVTCSQAIGMVFNDMKHDPRHASKAIAGLLQQFYPGGTAELALDGHHTGYVVVTLKVQQSCEPEVVLFDKRPFYLGNAREGWKRVYQLARLVSRESNYSIDFNRTDCVMPDCVMPVRISETVRARTGFTSFGEMVNTKGAYVPTLKIDNEQMEQLANAYDQYQATRNDTSEQKIAYFEANSSVNKPKPKAPKKLGKTLKEITHALVDGAWEPLRKPMKGRELFHQRQGG